MATALDRCLAQQVTLARQLLAALQAEARHLQTPTVTDALHASTRDKLACVQAFEAALADFKQVRGQTLVALGYACPPDEADGRDQSAWAQALHAHPHWAQSLHTLHTLTEQARQLNAQNGITLQSCLRHTHHALLDLQQFKSSRPLPGHLACERRYAAQPLYTAKGRVRLAAPAGLTPGIRAG